MSSTASFRGKNVIVTGAASGIGRATAGLFFGAGANVAATDVDFEGLKAAVSELRASCPSETSGSIAPLELDSGDAAAIKEARPAILAFFASSGSEEPGRVHVLVNNAGVGGGGAVNAGDEGAFEACWDRAVRVNLLGQVRMVRAFFDELTSSRRGGAAGAAAEAAPPPPPSVVVNVASTEGLGATLFNSAYTATKHASVGLTKALAVELGAQNCRCVAICPGPTRTGMTAGIPDKAKADFALRLVPLRRYAEPAEVAAAIAAVCGEGCSFLNGAIVPVDGGISAHMAMLPRRDWFGGGGGRSLL